jgi:hypothetical protein
VQGLLEHASSEEPQRSDPARPSVRANMTNEKSSDSESRHAEAESGSCKVNSIRKCDGSGETFGDCDDRMQVSDSDITQCGPRGELADGQYEKKNDGSSSHGEHVRVDWRLADSTCHVDTPLCTQAGVGAVNGDSQQKDGRSHDACGDLPAAFRSSHGRVDAGEGQGDGLGGKQARMRMAQDQSMAKHERRDFMSVSDVQEGHAFEMTRVSKERADASSDEGLSDDDVEPVIGEFAKAKVSFNRGGLRPCLCLHLFSVLVIPKLRVYGVHTCTSVSKYQQSSNAICRARQSAHGLDAFCACCLHRESVNQ